MIEYDLFMTDRKIEPVIKSCRHCGKQFAVGGRGRPRKQQELCSKRCLAFSRIRQPTIAKLAVTQQSYIAGLFDGEGSIILYDRGYGGRPQLRCTISNTFEPLMNWLKETTATGSIVRHIHPKEKGYRDSLTWQCYGQNAVRFLQMTLPFLIIKKEKAEFAIETQRL
jgi:hypothetical protein